MGEGIDYIQGGIAGREEYEDFGSGKALVTEIGWVTRGRGCIRGGGGKLGKFCVVFEDAVTGFEDVVDSVEGVEVTKMGGIGDVPGGEVDIGVAEDCGGQGHLDWLGERTNGCA